MSNPLREISDRAEWSLIWYEARRNMPRRQADTKGSPLVLRLLLGYKVYDPNGHNSASQHFHTASTRGHKPREEWRAILLKMLASQHGKTIAKTLAARRGLDLSKYPKWP